MKRTLILLFLICTLCCGCGAQEVEAATNYSEFVYNVNTGDTVTMLFETEHQLDVSVDKSKSTVTYNGNTIGTMEFADTGDVLSHVHDVVPTTVANNPYYRLVATYDYVAAMVLNDTTSVVFVGKDGFEDFEELLADCSIFVY